MREAARARHEAEAALAAREARGCVAGRAALERWEALGAVYLEAWARARRVRSISPACALREWRWLAGLRRWRWRAAFRRVGAAGEQEEGASQARKAAVAAAHGEASWAVAMGPEVEVVLVGGPRSPPLVVEDTAGRDSLDVRAVAAWRKWRDGGGRRRLEWLRRWEVDEGREADSRGRWRVVRVLDVRRPAYRQGRQLEVRLEWAGVDTASGEAWATDWRPLSYCTADVRREARLMELVKYPRPRTAEPPVGSRKSPRLEEEADAGAATGAAEAGAGTSEGGGQGRTEEDPLEAMLVEAGRRKRGRQEMLARVEARTDELFDNGVRINPTLREMSRLAADAGATAEVGPEVRSGSCPGVA